MSRPSDPAADRPGNNTTRTASPTQKKPGSVSGGIGERVLRREDARFIQGHARFVDDIPLPGMLHAYVVRSSHAHARLLSVSTDEAAEMPGIRLILTAQDLAAIGLTTVPLDIPPPGRELADSRSFEQPILARDEVRYMGEPIAFIVADTLEQAHDAADTISPEFSDLPVVTDVRRALAGDALAWSESESNTVFHYEEGDAASTDAIFSTAPHIVSLELGNNRVNALPLETRGCIGQFERKTEQFTLHASTQRVHILQRTLADRVFCVPRERMRVIAPDTGGGFGQKNGLYPEYVLCLEAARRLDRPVKWVADRSEGLASDNHGRDNHFIAEAAVDESGTILAIRARRLMNLGAYTAPRSMVPAPNGLTHLTGVYAVTAAHITVHGLLTNTACTSPYRGAGRPENVFCCERLVDVVARRLDLDPIELRRRNLLRPEAMPWTSPLGTRFESMDFAAILEDALVAVAYDGFAERRARMRADGKLRGIGVGLFAEDLHGSDEPVPVRLSLEERRLTILVGTGSAGHGHETSFLQIAAERLHIPAGKLGFAQSDTARIRDGIGTAASWSITLGGSSVQAAADAAISEGRRIAARLLNASIHEIGFDNGLFRAIGSNKVLSWDDIFEAEPAFSAGARFEGHGQSVNANCHACEVEVTPETGGVSIIRYAVAGDYGQIVNPMLVEGQLHGGVAQGVGQGWMERIAYEPQSGQLLSGSLSDYALPRAADLSNIATTLSETRTDDNPLGVKGMGEAAATGSTPAFVNAVLDALAEFGIHEIEIPLTSMQIWSALRDAPR